MNNINELLGFILLFGLVFLVAWIDRREERKNREEREKENGD